LNDAAPPAIAEAQRKAEALLEALSYIRAFRHRTVVIKLGGSVLEEEDALEATLQDVVCMETVGLRPVLVHGGGKAITQAMAKSGIEARFVRGRRVTDEATLEIVSRTLVEEINADLVARIDRDGGSALGLHHKTRPVLFGEKLHLEENGATVDLGRVGGVTRIEDGHLMKLLGAGIVPVLPSLAVAPDGGLLNVNADTAASAVAEALKAEKLIFISDTPGILAKAGDESTLLRSLTEAECLKAMADGTISGGMIPKVEACLASLRAGVRKIHLIDGRVRHSLLMEIYTQQGVGTEIVLGRNGAAG
jgi:acetylglutamate kinase